MKPLCRGGSPQGAGVKREGQCTHEGPRFFFKWETARDMTSCMQGAHSIVIALLAHLILLDSRF